MALSRCRTTGHLRRIWVLLTAVLLGVGLTAAFTPAAFAADTASMSIQKSANVVTVEPGQAFAYTIQFQCTAGTVNGCVNATITDPLPPYVSLNGQPTIAGSTNNPTIDPGPPVVVAFNDNLGSGQIGLAPGNVIVLTIPVKIDDDIPVEASGQPLVNTATITADNAAPKSDDATITPNVESTLDAVTTKTITPAGAAANPGTTLAAALTGQNTSNVPVDTLVIQDPVDPDATPSPFEYLGITDPLPPVAMPAGADTVQVSLYVNGTWFDGPSGPPQPALPDGVDPAEATGVRWTFASTDGADIPVDATAGVGINLVQRANVLDLTDPITITNDANTTVGTAGDSATSTPAGDTYKIPPSALDVIAGKSFDPDTVHAGDPSTVTVTGTNNSDGPLNTMTITEPAPATTNPFTDGLTFDGMGSDAAGAGISWPTGATQAAVTYTGPGCPGTALTTTTVNTLPGPPTGCTVTGYTVTFTGLIAPGATAMIPFVVTTSATQTQEELTRDNTVQVAAANDVTSATDLATDSITSIVDRIDVITTKTVVSSPIPAWPGEIVTAELTGQLAPFPASTVPATQIIVQDPSTLPDPNQWYDSFDPVGIVATPVPGCSTGTVQYTTSTGDPLIWTDVPGMVDIPPGIYNGTFPQNVQDTASGVRFIYSADPAGGNCSGGFPPGTSVAPNMSYSLEGDVPNEAATLTDCAASSATNGTVHATSPEACDEIEIEPYGPGTVDPIDKAWDVDILNARSQQEAGATLSWSTNGFTGIGLARITDTQNPDTTPLPASVFDEFDLVRVDPITANTDPHTGDPWLTYDQVLSFQLYQLPVGSTDPTAGSWVTPAGSPCPSACDGTFPGYTLTDTQRAVTIGFRLDFIESPTRGSRLSSATPPVGSGVAVSTGNTRRIHPVFQLRDDKRSDPGIPITQHREYNVTGNEGVIDNTVRADPFRDPDDTTPISTFTDHDTIALLDVPVTADATKTWDGGPLGIPDPAVPQEQWPTARVRITGTNTTPAKVDALSIADPADGTDPFDAFNLVGFASISPPGDIGATDLTVTLNPGPGGKSTYTRDEALALTEGQLVDVTAFTLNYLGRINAADAGNSTATVVFDTRLRTTSRSTGQPPQPGTTVTDTTTSTVSDLIDYAPIPPTTQDASATDDIQLVPQGIDVVAGKSFSPDSIIEPATGPVTATISGRPIAPGGGPLPPSRAVQLVLTDSSTTFWNGYDLVQLNPITFVYPVNQVQVDAYTGGSWSIVAGRPVLTGGSWQNGTPTSDPNVELPGTVTTPGQVQGLRYTFTRTDGANWENPANPTQSATFQVQRRGTLNTGGDVLPDLAQNPPAPGETTPGTTTNTVTADVTSSDVNADGDPLTATDDAGATIVYRHASNAVTVSKVGNNSPGSTVSPGADFPYQLTVTNSGVVDITNPVITDRLPTDPIGPQVVLADDPQLTYTLTGGTGMPTDPDLITITLTPDLATATQLQWTFPQGSTIPVGATYTITYYVHTRPGLPANTVFTNDFGVTNDRPWDQCANGGTNTVDPVTGECATRASNTILSAGAVSVAKAVRAEGSDELGVVLDPLTRINPVCQPDADGFYRRPCIPIAEPGGDITWRLRFINTGNRPIDRVLGIDRLPAPDDAVAIAPILPRGSQWRPLLSGERPTLANPAAGQLTVYYTTGTNWCDQPQAADGELLCGQLDWQQWPEGPTAPVDAATITGIQVEFLPATSLAPAAYIDVNVAMVAPAYSVADTPNTTASSGAQTYAYNSVGTAGRWNTGATTGYTLSTEPPRVGVGLAHGPLRVEKLLDGDAAGKYAPDSFPVALSCISAGQDVPLGAAANLTLTPDVPLTVYDLPVYAVCTLSEGANGQTSSTSAPATVPPEGTVDIPVAKLTNVYQFASLTVKKTLVSDAVDQDGNPIPYGPFTVRVDCTYLGEDVFAQDYDAGKPMEVVLEDDQSKTFEQLPAGAECTVTEPDNKGAETTITTTSTGGTAGSDGVIVLDPDTDEDTNIALVTNVFGEGLLQLTKEVTGDAAANYGAGPFTLHVTCVLDDATGERTVWDDDVVLQATEPGNTATIDDLATGAGCTVTEPDDGGASAVTIAPEQPVVIGDGVDQIVTVTVTNSFDPGELLLTKQVTGDAKAFAPASFDVEVTCSANGAVLPGFPTAVTVSAGQNTEVPALIGASCTAEETGNGSATGVTYDPPAPEGETGSGAVIVGPDPQTPIEIGITNEYRAGGLQIVKELTGPGAGIGPGPFEFTVDCSFNGIDGVYSDTVTLERDDDATELASPVIAPLPVGAVCDVTETRSGGADLVAPPVTVTIPDVDSAGIARVAIAGFVNTFSAATVQVTKIVAGNNQAAATGLMFTLAVTCQVRASTGDLIDVYAGTVQVSGGQTVPVIDADGDPVVLQLGAHCFAVETDNGGASSSSIDFDSYDNAVVVESAGETGTLTITAVNTFDRPPVPSPYPPQWPDTGGSSGSLSWTGFPAAQWVLIGLALLAAGAAAVSLTRRKRTG